MLDCVAVGQYDGPSQIKEVTMLRQVEAFNQEELMNMYNQAVDLEALYPAEKYDSIALSEFLHEQARVVEIADAAIKEVHIDLMPSGPHKVLADGSNGYTAVEMSNKVLVGELEDAPDDQGRNFVYATLEIARTYKEQKMSRREKRRNPHVTGSYTPHEIQRVDATLVVSTEEAWASDPQLELRRFSTGDVEENARILKTANALADDKDYGALDFMTAHFTQEVIAREKQKLELVGGVALYMRGADEDKVMKYRRGDTFM